VVKRKGLNARFNQERRCDLHFSSSMTCQFSFTQTFFFFEGHCYDGNTSLLPYICSYCGTFFFLLFSHCNVLLVVYRDVKQCSDSFCHVAEYDAVGYNYAEDDKVKLSVYQSIS
jgi:hypothetical protein